MEIKTIYHKNGVLTHEYKVDGNDVEEIISNMELNNDLKNNFKSYLDSNECVLIKRGLNYLLGVNKKEYTSDKIEKLVEIEEEDKDDKPYSKNYNKFKKGI